MKIGDIMRTDLDTRPPDTGFREIVETLLTKRSRLLYILDGGRRLLGVIGNFEILCLLMPQYLDANLVRALSDDTTLFMEALERNAHKTAGQIMNSELPRLETDHTVLEADVLIKEKSSLALPVVDPDGVLLGEVTRDDILSYIAGLWGLQRGGGS